MILSDKTILKMLAEKTLVIEPLEKEQIQPASVDIRLGNTFSIVEDSCTGIINLEKEVKYKTITSDTYILCQINLFLQQQWNTLSCQTIDGFC